MTGQETTSTEVMNITEQEAKELGEAVLRVLEESGEVRKAIMDIVRSCPNVVTQS